MIVGTIERTIEQESTSGADSSRTDLQWRVLWDDKLWRPLDDSATAILEAFCGIKAADIQKFSDKLADDFARTNMVEMLMQKHRSSGVSSWSMIK